MIRSILRAILGLALRLFFSRIEVSGAERLPREGALMFVQNHPNALVDPLFLLCLAPRPVSFLAKAPLFRMPIVALLVRALDSLPVYRAVDQNDPRKNKETFDHAQRILRKGGAIAIFPEGTTHSDSKMRPLKTGAARIALGAASTGDGLRLSIVPVGVYYTDKGIFRSKALVTFGEPIEVHPQGHDGDSSRREAVRSLSEQIRDGLLEVTVNAENNEALAWVARGQQIFSESPEVAEQGAVARDFAMRRRFVEGYDWYQRVLPARLEELERGIAAFEAEAAAAGVAPDSLTRATWPTGYMVRYVLVNTLELAALLGPAILGTLVNWPLYRVIGIVGNRVVGRKDSTAISTAKLGLSLALYPLLWLAVSLAAGYRGGASTAMAVAALCPLCAWCAVLFGERLARFRETLAPFALWRRNPPLFGRLYEERAALRDEIVRLGEEQALGDVPT